MCMKTLGPRLKSLRQSHGMTQQEVADFCGGIKKASVSAWESGKARPTLDALILLKSLYRVSIDDLIDGTTIPRDDHEKRDLYRVPLVDWSHIDDKESISVYESGQITYIPCPERHSDRAYAVAVPGHSMTSLQGRSYPEGRIIICEPDLADSAKSGQRVIAKTESGIVMFKELVEEDGRRWLRSLNTDPQYIPITCDFVVLAVVISSYIPE